MPTTTCAACGYDLDAIPEGPCPNCGSTRRGVSAAAVALTGTGSLAEVEGLVRDALAELAALPDAERDRAAKQLASEIVNVGTGRAARGPGELRYAPGHPWAPGTSAAGAALSGASGASSTASATLSVEADAVYTPPRGSARQRLVAALAAAREAGRWALEEQLKSLLFEPGNKPIMVALTLTTDALIKQIAALAAAGQLATAQPTPVGPPPSTPTVAEVSPAPAPPLPPLVGEHGQLRRYAPAPAARPPPVEREPTPPNPLPKIVTPADAERDDPEPQKE
jgi:hypothetical protein